MIVTSGVGYWGPPMRTASDAEVVLIQTDLQGLNCLKSKKRSEEFGALFTVCAPIIKGSVSIFEPVIARIPLLQTPSIHLGGVLFWRAFGY